jgi:hypothetical protein
MARVVLVKFGCPSEVGGIALRAASWVQGSVTIVLEIALYRN